MKKLKIPSYKDGLDELRTNLSGMLPSDVLNVFDGDAIELQERYISILKQSVGDKATDFSLSNATGEIVTLSKVLKKSNVVLTFYRGTWCPYCNLMLAQYQQLIPELLEANTVLIAVSSQTPDESLNIKEKNKLQFEVLSDIGNLVSRKYTTVFKYGEKPLAAMTELGYDFDSFYADDSRELPIPAVFVIKQNGIISFAKSEGGDYRSRVEGADIIKALKK